MLCIYNATHLFVFTFKITFSFVFPFICISDESSLPSRNRWALSKPSLDTGLFCIEEEEEQGEEEEEEEAIFRTN